MSGPIGSTNCYTKSLHNMPVGMCLRDGKYYLRRRIPSDLRHLLGRSEIWRSLRTDSFKCALRRFSLVATRVEVEFERARAKAGMSIDGMIVEANISYVPSQHWHDALPDRPIEP